MLRLALHLGCCLLSVVSAISQPHIILMVADDLVSRPTGYVTVGERV